MNASVLIVPGLRDQVANHWQTLLASRMPQAETVAPMGRANIDLDGRVAAIEAAAQRIGGPLIIVAVTTAYVTTEVLAARFGTARERAPAEEPAPVLAATATKV